MCWSEKNELNNENSFSLEELDIRPNPDLEMNDKVLCLAKSIKNLAKAN